MFKYVQVLSDSVKNGQKFEITGISKTRADTISVIFVAGSSPCSKEILKIIIDYNKHKVIINDASVNNFEVESGSKFEFLIFVNSDSFSVNLNDNNICEYKCQINNIRSITILGDVDRLSKINHLSDDLKNQELLVLESHIPNKLQPGHVIAICGECTEEF